MGLIAFNASVGNVLPSFAILGGGESFFDGEPNRFQILSNDVDPVGMGKAWM